VFLIFAGHVGIYPIGNYFLEHVGKILLVAGEKIPADLFRRNFGQKELKRLYLQGGGEFCQRIGGNPLFAAFNIVNEIVGKPGHPRKLKLGNIPLCPQAFEVISEYAPDFLSA
jgi:hypothetical protein